MPKPSDVTSRIERNERLESRAGIRLTAISAYVRRGDDPDDEGNLTVMGEVHPLEVEELATPGEASLVITAVAYDAAGRVIGRGSEGFDRRTFFGFEPFEIGVYGLPEDPSVIRLLVK